MAGLKLHEQISALRRKKGVTQEELAQFLGVTNQTVSKWESASCCPDIQHLPQIAAYFQVSIDELMGYPSEDSLENVYRRIQSLFQAAPKEDLFSIAYTLASLLHEGVTTNGYRGYVPWDTGKDHALHNRENPWGFSACSEPEGVTVHRGATVLIADRTLAEPADAAQIREIHATLKPLCDAATLQTLFALYELTCKEESIYVSLGEIRAYCGLSEDRLRMALDCLPVEVQYTDGEERYRLTGCRMHIPAVLQLLVEK